MFAIADVADFYDTHVQRKPMNRHQLRVGLSVFALAAVAACGGGEEEAPDAVMVDTVTQPGTATVQVPVTDTAIVQQEISIDTTISTDTTVREGEARPPR